MDKTQQIRNLWHTCFDDTEDFIKLYFDRVYNEDHSLTIEKDDLIVSALQMLPYTMLYQGTEILVSYIYGACTAPSERGQGLMRQLLQQAFEVMKSRRVAVSVLIPSDPWLFDYYREQGYTEAFNYTLNTYVRPASAVQEPNITVMPPEVTPTEQLFAYFDRKLRQRPCCMLHTPDDFITILRDLQLDGGQMLTALNEKEDPVGMAFISPSTEGILIKELLYDNEQIKELLLQEATLQFNVSQTSYRTLPASTGTIPLGMARVIDTQRLPPDWINKHPYMSLMLD